MAYEVKDLDPIKELSPTRRRLEFGIVFLVVFLLVRFGGWHHNGDPLNYTENPSTVIALLAAILVASLVTLWRTWASTHTAVRDDH